MEIEIKPRTLKRAGIIFGVVFIIDVILEQFTHASTFVFFRFLFLWSILSWIGLYIRENHKRKWFWIYIIGIVLVFAFYTTISILLVIL